MKQNKPMNQIDKLKEEFDKEFGPKTIWVVPSKENIETIKDIWSWIIQNFTPKEEMEKLLERVEAIIWSFSKYEISGNNGKYIDEELLKKVIQSLNKLKEEVEK